MSCKSWWWRGGGNQTGTSGKDWLFGGRGDNVIDARGGNDFIWAGRGHDIVHGGSGHDYILGGRGNDNLNGDSGSDRVYAGSGDDTGVYNVSENAGARDVYHGGRGNDVLVLQMTHAEFESAQVKADLEAFDSFLARQGSACHHHSFRFEAFDLKVKGWERYEIQFTDSVEADNNAAKNTAPQAAGDNLTYSSDVVTIQESEPNDPDQGSKFADAQVIERANFRIAPSEDVGNESLPRVSIVGAIAGNLPVTGPDANDVDLFAIKLQPGETLILDIDHAFEPGSQMNAQLFVMDASGSVLLENDDAPTSMGGAGSLSPRDSYLEFTDPGSGGTYYVAISTWNNDPLGSSGNFSDFGFVPGQYVLNVSIDNPAPDLGALVIGADELLANDSDADGDSLAITKVGNAINGTVEISDSGDILFKPGTDSPGSFDYTISDGKGAESTATVTVNAKPVTGTASNDVLISTSENELFSGGDGNDTFNFATGSGHDTISDFTRGSDVLAITDSMSVGGVQPLGNDTLIDFDTGDSVLLVGVSGVTDVNDLFVV